VSLGILGNKIGMTQVFDENGNIIPVTIIKLGPCFVTQIKSTETCGYNAIQLGYSEVSANSRKLTKPNLGHFSKNNLPPFRHLKEYQVTEPTNYEVGQEITIDIFEVGQDVNISGLTIGKGFAGNIKRNNHNCGPMSHGSKNHRLLGSNGAGTTPGRVFPGKKMAGRMGGTQTTVQGLEIIDIDNNENLLVVKGSVPGKTGNLVSVKINS
jgi:large subunit ribosomal protein L3